MSDADAGLLQQLVEFGFPAERAAEALRVTGSRNIEAAILWLCDEPAAAGTSALAAPATEEEYKAVLVVVADLLMSPGKVAAQAAHAAVGLYKRLCSRPECAVTQRAWEAQGEKTVVVSATGRVEAAALARAAESLQLTTHAVYDAGRTEVAPGSFTVLGIVGAAHVVDQVTGRLPLLR